MRVILIADDLTGALDSSVAFASRGLRTVCAPDPDALAAALRERADVLAVSTNSRELSQEAAIARVRAVRIQIEAQGVDERCIWFKKIDSRMKGHVAAEIAALRHAGTEVLVCPAIPRLGRIVRDGLLVGTAVSQPIPVATLAGVRQSQAFDAETQSDFATVLETMPDGCLLVGAAGFAEALAQRLVPDAEPREITQLPAPALIAIGSRDPVTLAQIEGFDPVPAPNGAVPHAPDGTPTFRMIQLSPGTEMQPSAEVSKHFAGGVAAWLRAAPWPTLVASGGETAAGIMAELGIGLLEVLGEALPGLPVSKALDGKPGLVIVTKSGGFGDSGTLVNLTRKLVKTS